MYNYDFKTKELKHIFDDLKWVVNNSNINIKCNVEDAKVVEMFDNKKLMVALPIESLGKVEMVCDGRNTKSIFINGHKTNYTIHGDILYLRRNE